MAYAGYCIAVGFDRSLIDTSKRKRPFLFPETAFI